MKKKIYILLLVLTLLVPLGLLTDADAWGEWDVDYFKTHLGFIPQGAVKLQNMLNFKHLLPDYSIPGSNEVIGYYISAIVGIILIGAIYYLIYLFIKRKKV